MLCVSMLPSVALVALALSVAPDCCPLGIKARAVHVLLFALTLRTSSVFRSPKHSLSCFLLAFPNSLVGMEAPLELHIVHFIKKDQLPACGDPGCPVVLGAMVALTDKESDVTPELRRVIEAMPLNEGGVGKVTGDLDVNKLLPTDRAYFTYEGSLTTPPCRWE